MKSRMKNKPYHKTGRKIIKNRYLITFTVLFLAKGLLAVTSFSMSGN